MRSDGRFTVVGAGRSGLAAANALAVRGADVRLVDGAAERARPPELDARIPFEAGTNLPRRDDVAVLSPGIKEVSPVRGEIAAVASEVIGEVELFYRLCPAPVLAITGTDGKSTVTTMLGDIVAASGAPTVVGGNLGNPLCAELDGISADSVVVAEISAFQLTTCVDFRPRVAVVTNIAEDHIDYHGSRQAYEAAKRRIWSRMDPDDHLVLNGDDRSIARWQLPTGPALHRFGLTGGGDATVDGGVLKVAGQRLMDRAELPLLGDHNVANALAASLAAYVYGIPLEVCARALSGYRGLPHRLRVVRTVDDVRWINDSKATNPNAASAALRAVEAPVVLLAGGSDKQTDFGAFGSLVRARTEAAVLFGETASQLQQAIGEHPTHVVRDIDQAVALAADLARSGEGYTVLLSPACASYDQFKSYAHRGEVFEALVEAL